jgi:hypothetical protein
MRAASTALDASPVHHAPLGTAPVSSPQIRVPVRPEMARDHHQGRHFLNPSSLVPRHRSTTAYAIGPGFLPIHVPSLPALARETLDLDNSLHALCASFLQIGGRGRGNAPNF